MSCRAIFLCRIVVGILVGMTSSTMAQESPGPNNSVPAALVGEDLLTLQQVEQAVPLPLSKLEEQRYELLETKLQELIGDRLLAQEAKKRGIPVEQLLEAEVWTKTPEVTDTEVTNLINQNMSRVSPRSEAALKLKAWQYLIEQKLKQLKADFVQSLRARTPIAVYLQPPQTARVLVSTDNGFVRGTKEARVTIVEFSDFQCPFCKAATSTLKRLLEDYQGEVRLIFRDYPSAAAHPLAAKAHEAARCAADQGKFWEYHDLLFDKSPRLSHTDLRQYARDLHLNVTEFNKCLESGKHQAEVTSNVHDGMRLGIEATPTFFINGRLLVGSQPIASFQKIIDNELGRTTSR